MAAGLTVGDFSRATHLSVKTLHHYHQMGLLEPATVNPDTGYRYYSAGQIPTAQVIRRLRDLEMPVADVKAVLAAPDAPARNALIAAHLNRLEAGPAIFRADASRAYG
jgi:DNA-binding transcriptional MerR regulator